MINQTRLANWFGANFGASVQQPNNDFVTKPQYNLSLTKYQFTPANWVPGLKLKIAVLTDLHACNPWMNLKRISEIVERTNDLSSDLILLLGDYATGMPLLSSTVDANDWGPLLGKLTARLGVYSVLGNHDWWEDKAAQKNGTGPIFSQIALEDAGIPVLENRALRLENGAYPFWIAGLADQDAFRGRHKSKLQKHQSLHDLPGTLRQITDDAPVLLMAHEPDIFPEVPDRVSLTLSGHTHGGQVRLFGYAPVVPSRFGNRYAYGHIIEDSRHLIVSGGLGCSIAPIRLGIPPEIVLLSLG